MCMLKKLILPLFMLCGLLIINVMPATTQTAAPTPPATAPDTQPNGIWGNAPGTAGQAGNTILPALADDQPVDPDTMVVSIAFAKADISNVLSFLSMASGVPIVLDADVKGTVTIISVKKVSLTMAYEVINSALRVRGYTMVGTLKDKLIRVVPLKKAISDKADVHFGATMEGTDASDSVITQVVPLQNASAVKLKDELKSLVSDDQANLLAVSGSNTLIITDTEGNVRRLLQIINLLDKDNTDVLDVEIYPCKYASAKSLTASLANIFTVTKSAQTPATPNQGRQQPDANAQPSIRTDDGVFSLKGELHIASDDRTNALVISASRTKINMVLEVVKKLDIDTTPEVRARAFTLKYADAQLVADQLNRIFEQPQGGTANSSGGFFGGRGTSSTTPTAGDYAGMKQNIIVPDIRTNTVIVTATEQNMKEFESMIAQLDSPTALSDITRSFPLKYASAQTLATTLTQLFRGGSQSRTSFFDLISGNSQTRVGDPLTTLRNITVVAETKSNTLLITGPPQAFSMVETIINQLDQRTVQVFIEVAIVDVTLDNETKFGVEWNWNSDTLVPGTTTPKSSVGTDFGLSTENTGLRYSVISKNLQALLHTLETRSNVKVYSTPSITTADNVQAKISIGQDIPFVSSEEDTSNGNYRRTVDFKNVSIALTVTPHVNETSSLIALDVLQTINELIGNDPELNSPIIANRQAQTSVMVNDGQTIVIGGIIKENRERALSAVPVLSKIPLLGEAFKSRTWRTQKSELMVFLTPHILRTEDDADKIKAVQVNKLSDTPPNIIPNVTKAAPASTTSNTPPSANAVTEQK